MKIRPDSLFINSKQNVTNTQQHAADETALIIPTVISVCKRSHREEQEMIITREDETCKTLVCCQKTY